jgi:hypothetical protein
MRPVRQRSHPAQLSYSRQDIFIRHGQVSAASLTGRTDSAHAIARQVHRDAVSQGIRLNRLDIFITPMKSIGNGCRPGGLHTDNAGYALGSQPSACRSLNPLWIPEMMLPSPTEMKYRQIFTIRR